MAEAQLKSVKCKTCNDTRRLDVGECTCQSKIEHEPGCGVIECPDCPPEETNEQR
jgi:hypothetical protein